MNFLYKNWAKGGLLIAVSLLIYIYFVRKHNINLAEKYIILNLAFLMLHQFEEYVYPGGFKDYFNNRIYNPFGFFKNRLTDKGIFFVNVVLGWGMNLTVLIFFIGNIYAMLAAVTVQLINGVMHFFMAFKNRNYNPGLVTGAILFIPLGLYLYNKLYSSSAVSTVDFLSILFISVLLSLMIPITIYLTRESRQR